MQKCFARIALLIILISGGRVEAGEASYSLSYPAYGQANEVPVVFLGHSYKLKLEPDSDIHGNVVTLELVLRHQNDNENAQNLLSPTKRSHGYQKYILIASDFAPGHQEGLDRELFAPSIHATVHIHVNAPRVTQGAGENTYSFMESMIDVTISPASK